MRTAIPSSARCQALWRLPSHPVAIQYRIIPRALPRRESGQRPRQQLPLIVAALTTQAISSPMESLIEETVERIHSSPFKLVMYVTGGASQVGKITKIS